MNNIHDKTIQWETRKKVVHHYKYKYILNEYYVNEGSQFKEEKRLNRQ